MHSHGLLFERYQPPREASGVAVPELWQTAPRRHQTAVGNKAETWSVMSS